jgi:hypothetical protein
MMWDAERSTKYGHQDTEPSFNFALLALMIMLGASIVMGIPYVLKTKTADGSKTFGQMLEDARKRRVGHMN